MFICPALSHCKQNPKFLRKIFMKILLQLPICFTYEHIIRAMCMLCVMSACIMRMCEDVWLIIINQKSGLTSDSTPYSHKCVHSYIPLCTPPAWADVLKTVTFVSETYWGEPTLTAMATHTHWLSSEHMQCQLERHWSTSYEKADSWNPFQIEWQNSLYTQLEQQQPHHQQHQQHQRYRTSHVRRRQISYYTHHNSLLHYSCCHFGWLLFYIYCCLGGVRCAYHSKWCVATEKRKYLWSRSRFVICPAHDGEHYLLGRSFFRCMYEKTLWLSITWVQLWPNSFRPQFVRWCDSNMFGTFHVTRYTRKEMSSTLFDFLFGFYHPHGCGCVGVLSTPTSSLSKSVIIIKMDNAYLLQLWL